MNHFDDPSDSPPPPAYSEQEFDQKLATATELSLAQLRREPNEWDVWDESVFEAAAKSNNSTLKDERNSHVHEEDTNQPRGDETRGGIEPLRIHKKNPSGGSSTPSGKQKPSWLAEAEGIEASTSTTTTSVAPAYTPGPSSSISHTTLPNPHSEQDWAATSPAETLPDPYAHEQWSIEESPATPPPPDSHLPPPPFSPSEDRLPDPYDNARRVSAPAIMDAGPPASMLRPISFQTNPYTDPDVEFGYQAQTALPQNDASPRSASSEPRYSLQPSPDARSPNRVVPSQLVPRSAANFTSNRSALPNSTFPRLNFDLSAAYGRNAVTRTSDTRPQQVNDAAALYNSAVSPHLGLHPKPPPADQNRQYHPIPASISTHDLQRTHSSAVNMLNRFSQLPPGAGPSYIPQAPTTHSTVIRSPGPTYPTAARNPIPQMVTEGQYGRHPNVAQSMTQTQAAWTEYNPYL